MVSIEKIFRSYGVTSLLLLSLIIASLIVSHTFHVDLSNSLPVQILYCLIGAACAGLLGFKASRSSSYTSAKAFFIVLCSCTIMWWVLKYLSLSLASLGCGDDCVAGTTEVSTASLTLNVSAIIIISYLVPAGIALLFTRDH